MKGKYIFVNQVTGPLVVDIMNDFVYRGCALELITGEISTGNTKLDSSIEVCYLTKYNRTTSFKRIVSWLLFYIQTFFVLLFKSKQKELFFHGCNVPPNIYSLGLFFNLIFNQQFHLLVYDLYPDVLINFGVLKKNSLLHKLWIFENKKTFHRAKTVFTIANCIGDTIKNYFNGEIIIIPLWTNINFVKPIPKTENSFAKQYNQINKFTVLYSGNLGTTHDIESIIEAARILEDYESINFIIIGDGAKRNKIAKMIKEYNLSNTILLPWQETSVIPFSFTTADIAIVTLDKGAETTSVPSKLFDMMAAGNPVIAIASKKSELSNILLRYNIGYTIEPDNYIELSQLILKLMKDEELIKTLSNNSRKAVNDFTPDNAKLFYDKLYREK